MQPDCMSGDIFDIRDVIERFVELEMYRDDINTPAEDGEGNETPELLRANAEAYAQWAESDEGQEFKAIKEFLESVKGYGGDEQWRGGWYPITFVSDSYFETFARSEAEDLGLIKSDALWPNNCIDWEEAAKQLQMDYSSVEIDVETYWYR